MPHKMSRKRWAILISGRGSNLSALLDLGDEMEISLVLSSNSEAPGLFRARRAGVPAEVTPLIEGTRKIDWPKLDQRLRQAGITHIFLAGFMRVIPSSFVDLWKDRILNLHPSLLPAYPGLNSIERAYSEGADIGVTVHVVTEEVDAGEVILQRRSLKAGDIGEYSLASAEFLVHVDEQRAVREAVRRWRA